MASGGREDLTNAKGGLQPIKVGGPSDANADMQTAVKNFAALNSEKQKNIQTSKEYTEQTKREQSNLQLLAQTVGGGLTNAFQAALNGTQSFASAFGEFILQLITKIVAAIAAAAVLAAILSFTGLGGLLGAGGGFSAGASSAGSFANLAGQFTGIKLATGGITTGPTHALIGEGREQEAVLPLSKLGELVGNNNNGGVQDGHIMGVLSGADLLLQFKRAQKQATRIGGNI